MQHFDRNPGTEEDTWNVWALIGEYNNGFREIRWKDVDWIHVIQDSDRYRSLVSTVINIWAL